MVTKKQYHEPALDVIFVGTEDVISTSSAVERPPSGGDIDQGSWL